MKPTGPEPTPGSSLDAILSRGYLRCGVKSRPGFAERINGIWTGFDIDLCRAIAAGVFGPSAGHDTVRIDDLSGTGSEYYSLVNNDVDVVASARVTLDAVHKEDRTSHAYTFSPSYFHDSFGNAFAMATSGTDSQWSDFVYWVVMTIIYAEESAGQQGLDSLPEVYLFGDGFRNLMKDAVNAVGSYKEIYVRHLEAGLPRSGANQVNMGQFKGPQQFPLPL